MHYLPIIGNTIEDLLHMMGGEEMTLRTTFSIGLGACDLRVTCGERNNYLIIGNKRYTYQGPSGREGGGDPGEPTVICTTTLQIPPMYPNQDCLTKRY